MRVRCSTSRSISTSCAAKRRALTPHQGEFARLSGLSTVALGTRVQRLREFTQRTGITTLLKGPATLIDDGERTHINLIFTPALQLRQWLTRSPA